MRKIIYISFFVLAGFLSSCKDMLEVESRTAATADFLFESPEGLSRAAVGLYVLDRSFGATNESSFTASKESALYIINNLDYCTDLMVFRGGTAAAFARLDNITTASGDVLAFWQVHYQIIGKANEIITAAERIGLDDPSVKQSWAEAKMFRGHSYFQLWKRFERLYLNTEPVTIDNMDNREYRAATTEQVFAQIKTDLDDAIGGLDWNPYGGQAGRWTKGVAKHVKAQVAMWENDYDEAIKQCEDIFERKDIHRMETDVAVIFSGANLTSKEFLYVYQMSANRGGGNTVSGGIATGHRVALNVTPNYKKLGVLSNCAEYGGYGWGRVYPNFYLLGLYNQAKDQRYTKWFRHKYYYNDSNLLPAGKNLGDEIPIQSTNYLECQHPSSLKHFDKWTNSDNYDKTSSFKDLPGYRLAETYLMASEAYFYRDGGSSGKAIEYYNETWKRAGNDYFDGPLTLDILLEEYARECHFEGVRWPLLKRVGKLEERVKRYNGDDRTSDPALTAAYTQARTNYRADRDFRWPIPLNELQLMPGFGQNEGWQ